MSRHTSKRKAKDSKRTADGNGRRPQTREQQRKHSTKALNLDDDGDFGSKQLDRQLSCLGFYAKEIIGDGNCLFRSFSDQIFGDPCRHLEIRQEVVKYMKHFRSEFEVFIEEDWDKYINRMIQDGIYGELFYDSIYFKPFKFSI